MTAAVMFDCDGVLVDSERLIAELLVKMTNDRGGSLTLADGHRMFRGAQLDLCAERISAHLGRDVDHDIAAEYRSRSVELFRRRLTAVDGVEDLIRSLTVPICVVSNSTREKVMFNLEVTRLAHYFSGRVYSAADLARWKPEPDIYLHAAAELGVDPAGCVAIEDSAAGVRSASLAGMRVIGFGGPELRDEGARWTCGSMREVHDLVDRLTRQQAVPAAESYE
jgi:HAD superfamily hydrolase (TIGR01509 family)